MAISVKALIERSLLAGPPHSLEEVLRVDPVAHEQMARFHAFWKIVDANTKAIESLLKPPSPAMRTIERVFSGREADRDSMPEVLRYLLGERN